MFSSPHGKSIRKIKNKIKINKRSCLSSWVFTQLRDQPRPSLLVSMPGPTANTLISPARCRSPSCDENQGQGRGSQQTDRAAEPSTATGMRAGKVGEGGWTDHPAGAHGRLSTVVGESQNSDLSHPNPPRSSRGLTSLSKTPISPMSVLCLECERRRGRSFCLFCSFS